MPGQGLLLVMTDVDPAVEGEFAAWYDSEHLPALAAVPGVLRARRYRLHAEGAGLAGELLPFIAVYDLERPQVQASDATRGGRGTTHPGVGASYAWPLCARAACTSASTPTSDAEKRRRERPCASIH